EETLAIFGDGVPIPGAWEVAGDAQVEQRFGDGWLKARTVRDHIHRHQLLVRRDVEQLLPVAPPPGLRPAVRGDRPLPAPVGKAPHIDLPPPRLVRAVGDPFPVWRELTMQLRETRPQERNRLLLPRKRQDP